MISRSNTLSAAGSRVSLGIVIIGGLLFSLGLTLYIIPSLYISLSAEKKSRSGAPAAPAAETDGV